MQTALKTSPRAPLDVIDGYYPDFGTNPTSVALTAAIPSGQVVPAIHGSDGNFYIKGVQVFFDDNWNGDDVPIAITIDNAPGWSIPGWIQTDNTWSSTILKGEIQSVVTNGGSCTIDFAFVNAKTGQRHDPGIVITRPT